MTDSFVTVISGQAAVPHQGSLNKPSLLLCLWDADASCLKQCFKIVLEGIHMYYYFPPIGDHILK